MALVYSRSAVQPFSRSQILLDIFLGVLQNEDTLSVAKWEKTTIMHTKTNKNKNNKYL